MTGKEVIPIVKYNNFRPWVQKVMPGVYDDTLSYYELLSKVVTYLNQMNDQQNEIIDWVSENMDRQNKDIRYLRAQFISFRDDMIAIQTAFEARMNKEWNDFRREILDSLLGEQVAKVLNEWLDNGKLADIINKDVFDMKADTVEVNKKFDEVTQHLDKVENSVGISIDTFPRLEGEVNDTARLKRAYDSLGTTGGVIRFPKGKFKFNIVIDKSNVSLIGSGRSVTTFEHADLSKPLIQIGNASADVRNTIVKGFDILGGVGNPPLDKPDADGIVVDGSTYATIQNVGIRYVGGDGLRITSTNKDRSTQYVFVDDFTSEWAFKASLNVNYGVAWVTGVYISNFAIQGYTNKEAYAILNNKVRLFLTNGWITCRSEIGHIKIIDTGMLVCSNVAIDSNSSSDTIIETTLNNTTSARRINTFINGIVSINGRWKRGDGVTGDFAIQGIMGVPASARITQAHVTGSLYFSDSKSEFPDKLADARQLYRDGTRIRSFFDDTYPSGVYLGMFIPTVPTSATSSGQSGYYSADKDFLYICYDFNSWIRIPKGTW